MPLNLYFATSEVAPFCGAYSLSTFSRRITTIYNEDPDLNIRVVHPKYGFISERKYILREVIRLKDLPIQFDGKENIINLKSAFIPESRVQVYFLQYNEYFKPLPELLYKARNGRVYKDNDEKFSFFSKVALSALKDLFWAPDIVLCNDWQTAMIPGLLNNKYKQDEFYQDMKTVFLLHSWNDTYRYYSKDIFAKLNMEPPTNDNVQDMLKIAMDNSDSIIIIDNEKEKVHEKAMADPVISEILDNKKHHVIPVPANPIGKWSGIAKSIKTVLQEI
jgi:starch synthase